MLKWNAAKVRNLTGMEVWLFIIARVLIAFAVGVLAARHFPQVADALVRPALLIGVTLFLMAARGMFRPTKKTAD